MVVDVKKLVAAINPDVYCMRVKEKFEDRTEVRANVKKIIKDIFDAVDDKSLSDKDREKAKRDAAEVYLKAVKQGGAELVETMYMDFTEVIKKPIDSPPPGFVNPIEQHTVSYEVSGQSVEQIYFWIHDYLFDKKSEYGNAFKLVDNFAASPGSNYFSELGMKATKMQEEAMKILGVIGQMIKAVLQITYDLKEFQLTLAPYKQLNSKSRVDREAAIITLKQKWLDQVDIKRGNSSIKAMAVSGMNQPNFVMLIDAFMAVESLEGITKMDLNERIKRILLQRYAEFEKWLIESERELKKRFEIEKVYLKSQYNNLQLYSRWVQPYLRAAKALEMKATPSPEEVPALVTAFETSVMELVLLGQNEYKFDVHIAIGDLPRFLKRTKMRTYYSLCLVEFKFRTIPERTQKGYGFRGRADITFTSFSLNGDEIQVLRDQIEKDNFGDLLELMRGTTTESIEQLKDDVEEFLAEPKEAPKVKEESSDTNPFSALFTGFSSLFSKSGNKKEEKINLAIPKIRPDDEFEKIARSMSIIEARKKCSALYGAFKKMNNMPSPPL